MTSDKLRPAPFARARAPHRRTMEAAEGMGSGRLTSAAAVGPSLAREESDPHGGFSVPSALPSRVKKKSQSIVVHGKIRLKDFAPDYCAGRDKKRTRKLTEKYRERIGELQELLYANSHHAVLLIFQGMDASGKDGATGSVLRHVNPIGVQVANFKVPSAEESAHDFLWRVHRAVPRFGNIGVFNRSHYEAVLVERVLELVPRKIWAQRYEQIVAWERMLIANRVVLLKFYLHLSREEQAERIRERIANPKKHWKFSAADLKTRARWDDYVPAYEDMIQATSHPAARWRVVPADRNWYRDYVVAKAVVEAMEALHMKWPRATENLSKIRVE